MLLRIIIVIVVHGVALSAYSQVYEHSNNHALPHGSPRMSGKAIFNDEPFENGKIELLYFQGDSTFTRVFPTYTGGSYTVYFHHPCDSVRLRFIKNNRMLHQHTLPSSSIHSVMRKDFYVGPE